MWRLSEWVVAFIVLLSCQAVPGANSAIVVSQASSTESTSLDSSLATEIPSVLIADSKERPTATLAIVLSIIGSLFLVALGVVVGCHFMRKRKTSGSLGRGSISKLSRASSITPTIASFVAGYSPVPEHAKYKELPDPPTPPYTYYVPPDSTTSPTPPYTYYVPPEPFLRSMSPGALSVATSSLSIVNDFEPSSADTCSPAAQSSNMYTEHSPLTETGERAMAEDRSPIQKRWKLTPVRRGEDTEMRVAVHKRWKLLPFRRVEDA